MSRNLKIIFRLSIAEFYDGVRLRSLTAGMTVPRTFVLNRIDDTATLIEIWMDGYCQVLGFRTPYNAVTVY